jgi:phosphatidate cytidylyltransferase
VCGPATAFWALLAPWWVIGRWPTRTRWLMAVVGIVTLTALWMALVELHAQSPWMLLGAMALVWVADTAAFFAGRRFGRHKLAPQVSPGKTWEGVAGAYVAVAVYAALCAYLGAGGLHARAVLTWVCVALVLTALSVVGDLYESWLKRNAGVKDSGALLPGHGGVLDRIDALLAAMPPAALAIGAWFR